MSQATAGRSNGPDSVGADSRTGVKRRLWRGLILTTVVLVAVYAWLIAMAGRADLADAIATANPLLLPLPLAATLLSYLTMSLSYEGIANAAGCAVRSRDMLRITFIANTANYILPTGGLSGFAMRMVMLNKKGIPGGRAVLVSFAQTILTNGMLMLFIAYGFIHLMLTGSLPLAVIVALSLLVAALALLLAGCLLLIYRSEWRAPFLSRASDEALRLLARLGKAQRFEARARRFFLHLEEGMEFLAARPRAMVGPCFWIFLDWLFTIAVLYTACMAIGADVSYGEAVIAFAVAIVAAMASFVPGGVGVLEVALAGMFASVGVPAEQAVLAILIFRVCFYVIPVLLSLALAKEAFRQVEAAAVEGLLR